MKAFLSTESNRHQYFEDANGPHAEREALMILRHTEPGERNVSGYGTDTAQFGIERLVGARRCAPLSALIDSLTDFVEG